MRQPAVIKKVGDCVVCFDLGRIRSAENPSRRRRSGQGRAFSHSSARPPRSHPRIWRHSSRTAPPSQALLLLYVIQGRIAKGTTRRPDSTYQALVACEVGEHARLVLVPTLKRARIALPAELLAAPNGPSYVVSSILVVSFHRRFVLPLRCHHAAASPL